MIHLEIGGPLTDDRSAALLVRVWLEDGGDTFRARVTAMGLDGSDDRTVALASSPDDVTDAVNEWLRKFVPPSSSASTRSPDG
jgi:hypothetical protein